MAHWEKTEFVKARARRIRRGNDRAAIVEDMANENDEIEDTRQPVYDDRQAAAQAAQEEAEAANITATGAVLESAPEGYGTGDGTVWPPETEGK